MCSRPPNACSKRHVTLSITDSIEKDSSEISEIISINVVFCWLSAVSDLLPPRSSSLEAPPPAAAAAAAAPPEPRGEGSAAEEEEEAGGDDDDEEEESNGRAGFGSPASQGEETKRRFMQEMRHVLSALCWHSVQVRYELSAMQRGLQGCARLLTLRYKPRDGDRSGDAGDEGGQDRDHRRR